MTHPFFGKALPVHFAILMLAGYDIDGDIVDSAEFVTPESQRLDVMRHGRQDLIEITGIDLSYDLAKWREVLLVTEEFGYKHPYAFSVVDEAIVRAIADGNCRRLANAVIA